MNELRKAFLCDKPPEVLIALLKYNYVSEVARHINDLPGNVNIIIKKFRGMGLIRTRWKGRKKTITLTDKGEILAMSLKELTEKLNKLKVVE